VKAIDFSDQAHKEFARLLVYAVAEMSQTESEKMSNLELLGVLSIRMLVGSQAIDMTKLTDTALSYAAEQEGVSARAILNLPDSFKKLFANLDELGEAGISFHTVQ